MLDHAGRQRHSDRVASPMASGAFGQNTCGHVDPQVWVPGSVHAGVRSPGGSHRHTRHLQRHHAEEEGLQACGCTLHSATWLLCPVASVETPS